MARTANNAKTRTRSPSLGQAVVAFLRQLLIHAIVLTLALPPAAMVAILAPASSAMAASYAEGYTKYQNGDFAGAQKSLKAALAGKISAPDKIKALKLLGICQYMQNDRPGATKSFQAALAQNPGLTISSGEVLDDSVIGFFNGLKKPAAPKGGAAPAPKGAVAGAKGGKVPAKTTLLKVASNVPNASVALDGIIAGQVNTLINTDPGKVLVEVMSPGYPTKKANVTIAKDQENDVTINLEKPQPKPKSVAKAQPKAKAQVAKGGGQDTGMDDGATAAAGASAALADDPYADPYAKNPPKRPAAPKRAAAKPKARRNAYAPDPGDKMFDDGGAGGYNDAQAYDNAPRQNRRQAPRARQPQGPDLASQFDMDSGAGYGAPAPGYGQPYPAAPAYPQYYAPPPQYYAPPPQYYAPPPPPPAAVDPYAQPVDPATGAPAAAAPNAAVDPAAADAQGGGGSGTNTFIALLPFGAGQFQNHRYILGLLFAGAEIGGLYYYKTQSDAATQAANVANAYNQQNCAHPGQDTTVDQTCNDYIAKSKAYVASATQNSYYGVGAFVGLWVIGAAQALMDDPPKAVAKSKKKKKKKRKYTGFSYAPELGPREYKLVEIPEDPNLTAFDWQAGMTPAYDPETNELKPALGIELKWTF